MEPGDVATEEVLAMDHPGEVTDLVPASAPVALPNPVTGEVVEAGDVRAIAEAIADVRRLRTQLNDAVAMLTAMAAAESERQGTRTLTAGGWTLKLSADTEIEWDVEVLTELLTAGLPEDRYNQLVTAVVSYKIDGRVVKQLEAASPRYAEIIGRARRRVPRNQYATVQTGGGR